MSNRAFMRTGGLAVEADVTLHDRKVTETYTETFVLGWANSISSRSKSKSLVAIGYVGDKCVSMYYLCRPSEAYEWEAMFGVPRHEIDRIVGREISVIKVVPKAEVE